jgi:hypothetical protein
MREFATIDLELAPSDRARKLLTFTLVALALITALVAGFYAHLWNPTGLGEDVAPMAETPGSSPKAGGAERAGALLGKKQASAPGKGQVKDQPLRLDYGDDWGVIPGEWVKSGVIAPRDAHVLNRATLRFAGSAAQASAAKGGE